MPYHSLFRALSNETRFAIFESLRHGPLTVGELASSLPVSRPAVSQHLKVLKEAGLVRDWRLGNRRYYGVATDGLLALSRYLEQLWVDVMATMEDTAAPPKGQTGAEHSAAD